MMILTYAANALKQLALNKGRSALTMLGIIIGIGSVIFIMTLGEVAKGFLLNQISQFGTNVIEVAEAGSFVPGESSDIKLTESDVEAVENSTLLPELTDISAGYTAAETLEYGDESWQVSVFGDRPAFFDVNNLVLLEGRLFSEADNENGTNVLVIDEGVAREIFDTTDVIGKRVRIDGISMTVIGLLEESAFTQSGGFGQQMVFAPLGTVRKHFLSSEDQDVVSYLLIEFEHGTDSASFENRLDFVLKEANGFAPEDDSPFLVVSRDAALGILDSVLLGVQAFVSAVAAISLLVGGIGIMNIMLVTVKERTKEIGLRKAIGAKHASVLTQFLIESVVLTTVGGIIGILSGLGLSALAVVAANAAEPDWGIQFVFVPSAIIIATGVAVAVGLAFGLYPALKASRLEPIEALRYE